MRRLLLPLILVTCALGVRPPLPVQPRRIINTCQWVTNGVWPRDQMVMWNQTYAVNDNFYEDRSLNIPKDSELFPTNITFIHVEDLLCSQPEKGVFLSPRIPSGGVGYKFVYFRIEDYQKKPYNIRIVIYGEKTDKKEDQKGAQKKT